MLNKRRPKRLGLINPTPVENAKKERKERVIDLSKYSIGFEQANNKENKSPSKAQATQYDKYLHKLDKGNLTKFSTRDIMFFFRDTANDNGVKYVIANPKIDMRQLKLALDRGYSNEDLLLMIEFLFTSGQTYLDVNSLHPGILVTNWCNTIYRDAKLWVNDEFDPSKKVTPKSGTPREWSDTNSEVKSNVGEWE